MMHCEEICQDCQYMKIMVTGSHLSREPGVIVGVSPTLRLLDFFAFFSKYFLARALSFALYSFSITLLSL
jgi:hypothetical protein